MAGQDQRLRIALVTARDPNNRKAWSGVLHFLTQALQRHCGDVTVLGPVPHRHIAGQIYNKLARRLVKKTYDYSFSPWLSRRYARIFRHRLAQGEYDVIIAPDAQVEIAFLRTHLPIVYCADATVSQLRGYHPEFIDLLGSSLRNFGIIQHALSQRAQLYVFSSPWAARSAIEDLHVDAARVHVVPLGKP